LGISKCRGDPSSGAPRRTQKGFSSNRSKIQLLRGESIELAERKRVTLPNHSQNDLGINPEASRRFIPSRWTVGFGTPTVKAVAARTISCIVDAD
jgi:hypothetical protein